jgi:magnesium transporter
MLTTYIPRAGTLERRQIGAPPEIPDGSIWFDLVTPTAGEDKLVERALGIAVPTREEMQEIEVSSRLYVENSARYMTATLMCRSETDTPRTTPVTFILAGHKLVTVRYDEPRPFLMVSNKLARACPAAVSGETILMDLLDAVIDRAADILERAGADIDRLSHDIFERKAAVSTAPSPISTSSRRSAAEATSPPRCARASSRSDGCSCSSPTRPTR